MRPEKFAITRTKAYMLAESYEKEYCGFSDLNRTRFKPLN